MAARYSFDRPHPRRSEVLWFLVFALGGLVLGAGITYLYMQQTVRLRSPSPLEQQAVFIQDAEQRIFFYSSPNVDRALFNDGWHEPETWGTWAKLPSAELIIPIGEAYSDLSLEARISAYQAQRVRVKVNGVEVGAWNLTPEPTPQSITIPTSVRERGKKLRVTFGGENTISPKERGKSKNPSQLGIGLFEVSVMQ